MSRRTADRPLTDAEERCLIGLADRLGRLPPLGYSEWGKPCRNASTLSSLHRLGYVELRLRSGTLDLEGRINEAGLELLRSMGD